MRSKRLILYVAVVWLILIVSFGTVAYWADQTTRRYHEDLFNEQQLSQVSLAKRGLENHLGQIVGFLLDATSDMLWTAADLSGPRLDPTMDRILKRPEVLAVNLYVGQADKPSARWSDVTPSHGLAEAMRQFCKSAPFDDDFPVQYPDFYLTQDHQVAGLVVRLNRSPDQKGLQAWLVVAIDLRILLDLYVAPLRFGLYGAGYALDGQGRVVYDHETEIIGRSVFDGMHDKYPNLLELDRRLVSEESGKSEYRFTVQRGGAESRKLIAWDTALLGEKRIVLALSAPDGEVNASLGSRREILLGAVVALLIGLVGTTIVVFRMRHRILVQANADLARTVEQRTEALNRELKARTESEERVRDYAEVSSDWFWETDAEHRFTYFSKRSTGILNVNLSKVTGLRRQDITTDDIRSEKWIKHLKALENQEPFRDFRYSIPWGDGTKHMMSTSGKPVYDADGRFVGYRGSGTDITDEIRTQEVRDRALVEAERANRTKSHFLATMSHELRTPLNAIIGFSDVLANQYFGPPTAGKYEEYAKDIHSSARYLLDLVNDLLDMARIESGKATVEKSHFEPTSFIRDCLQAILPKASEKSLRVEVDVADDIPVLNADRRALKQVLLNLLSNSVKFTPKDGRIDVTLTRTPEGAEIRVSDTGSGIAPDRLAVIKEPFERGRENAYESQEGWGLGLSIANALVLAHGGRLEIDSEQGKGTVVTVVLPGGVPDPATDSAPAPA